METNKTRVHSDAPEDERADWHKPEIQRLKVVLDTKDGAGSSADSYVFTGPGR